MLCAYIKNKQKKSDNSISLKNPGQTIVSLAPPYFICALAPHTHLTSHHRVL